MDPSHSITFISTLPLCGVVINTFSISILLAIVSIFVLLILIAFVSAAESAFFSLSPTEMEELNSSDTPTDEKILELINTPKRLLATLLISVNFLSIAIVILNSTFIFGEDGLFNFSQNPLFGFIVQVILITFLILLVGEVTPKIYATQNSLSATRTLVNFVKVLQRLFYPISSFLIFSTSLLDKVIKPQTHNISIDELSQALDLTNDEDIAEEDRISPVEDDDELLLTLLLLIRLVLNPTVPVVLLDEIAELETEAELLEDLAEATEELLLLLITAPVDELLESEVFCDNKIIGSASNLSYGVGSILFS